MANNLVEKLAPFLLGRKSFRGITHLLIFSFTHLPIKLIMSIENPTLAHFRHFSSLFTPSALYICREPSTNQLLFMQNKPNLLHAQMNLSILSRKAYESKSNWTFGENKPNSKPIKANFRKAKMNINSLTTNDYIKKDDFVVRINKPNSNPISEKPKMNANVFVTKDYENETAFRPRKYKPNQTQFHLPPRHALSYTEGGKTEVRCRMEEVRFLSSAFCFLSSVHVHLLVSPMKPKLMRVLIYQYINRRKLNYYRSQAPKTADLGIKKGRKKRFDFFDRFGYNIINNKIPLGPGGGHLNNRVVKGVLSVKLKTLTN